MNGSEFQCTKFSYLIPGDFRCDCAPAPALHPWAKVMGPNLPSNFTAASAIASVFPAVERRFSELLSENRELKQFM